MTKQEQKQQDHALVELRYAEKLECVRCSQQFSQEDTVTLCPNSDNGSHAIRVSVVKP